MNDSDVLASSIRRARRTSLRLTHDGRAIDILILDPKDASQLGRISREEVCAVMSTALETTDGLVAPMRRHSLDPALTPLGPWRPPSWMRGLGVLSEIPADHGCPPMALVSRSHALCGTHVLGFDQLLAESPSPHGHGWSTIASDGAHVIKSEICSTEYLERAQVPGEAWFLEKYASARPELQLPQLRGLNLGQGVNTLIRDHVEGMPVIGLRVERRTFLASDLLALQVAWSSAGLSHNDLRPWNLLASPGGVHLVDFADAGATDADVNRLPQMVALAGLLAWLLGVPLSSGPDFAAEVRAAAEFALARRLDTSDPRDFPWDARVISSWAPLLSLPAHKAFEGMLMSGSGGGLRS